MTNRNLKIFHAYLQQAGDIESVDLNDADHYCMCITAAARVILKGYLTERGVTAQDTIMLSPLLKQCRSLHVVLPTSIRQACAIWDDWECKHKLEDKTKVTKKKLWCGTVYVKELGDYYALHNGRSFVVMNLKEDCLL